MLLPGVAAATDPSVVNESKRAKVAFQATRCITEALMEAALLAVVAANGPSTPTESRHPRHG